MIITIENFGAIKHFKFDTEKNLYLIFGKNSMGKSYAISLVYLILKNIENIRRHYIRGTHAWTIDTELKILAWNIEGKTHLPSDISPEWNLDLKVALPLKIEKISDKEIDISNYIERHFTEYLQYFVDDLNKSLKNTFSSVEGLQNQFTKEELKITIEWEHLISKIYPISGCIILGLKENLDPESDQKIQVNILKSSFSSKILLRKVKKCLNPKFSSSTVTLYFSEGNKEHFIESYQNFLLNELVNIGFYHSLKTIRDVFYLPASRSGSYQSFRGFGQIFAELAKNRSYISKSVEIPAISEPVADYLSHLFVKIDSSLKSNHELSDYVNEIENAILQGSVEFDNQTKRLLFTPNKTSLKLDLSATSSMVSEVSLIVSYLKYILPDYILPEKKPLVFIEEPEAHLHPETQVKLIAIFAKLVKDDKIKLVITSHSNYIFNKASNLVMDNKIDQQKFAAVLFENTPEGSVARNLETDEYGIEDNNFVDTAESIYEEKLDLINKLNGQ